MLKNTSIKNKHLNFELTLYFLLQNLRYDECLVFLWNNLIPTQLSCNSNTIYKIIAFYTIFESMTTLFRNSFDVSKSSRKYVNLILSHDRQPVSILCIMREITLYLYFARLQKNRKTTMKMISISYRFTLFSRMKSS